MSLLHVITLVIKSNSSTVSVRETLCRTELLLISVT